MKTLRRIFRKLAGSDIKSYCICGHAVSSNLAFCPHCGRRLADHIDHPAED